MSEGSGKYDRSFADLMAGVAVVFLLLAVMFILEVSRQRDEAIVEKQRAVKLVDTQKEQVHRSLLQLHDSLDALNHQLDGGFLALSDLDGGVNVLEIEFKDLQFDSGKCRTPTVYAAQFQREAEPLIGNVCDTIAQIRDAGAEATITLEGHTDNQRFLSRSPECGVSRTGSDHAFENNVRASASRAQEVFFTLRDALPGGGIEEECLDQNFVVSGRGEASPRPGTTSADPSNRRLVIRVRGDLRL